MPTLLRRLPIPTAATHWVVRGEAVRIKPYQVPVWVSLTRREFPEWDPRIWRFPALIDTAHNHNFSIQQRHLVRWAGVSPQSLRRLGYITVGQRRIPLLEADTWLHRNVPGQLAPAEGLPFALFLKEGIAVYPDDSAHFPRLPLLGLRAIIDNRLHLAVSGWRRSVTLRTRRRWWFFG